MRIISKFHDYYDIGMSHGQDQSLVYKRFSTIGVFPISKWNQVAQPFEKETSLTFTSYGIQHKRIVIGFCGSTYLCYRMEADVKERYNPYKVITYLYDAEAVRRFINIYGDKGAPESFMKKPHPWRSESMRFENVKRLFDEWNCEKYNDKFIENKIPIFVVEQDNKGLNFEANAKLKDYEFFKVINTYTAFQEISMFIGGVLGAGEPFMIEIEDKYKIEAKGFNDQSFKTRPGTKPNRKNKRKK